MSADFWAGYISGATGIVIGNPLDVLKVRLQAFGTSQSSLTPAPAPASITPHIQQLPSTHGASQLALDKIFRPARWLDFRRLSKGIAPPLLTYGPLNALLFVTYNNTLSLLDRNVTNPSEPPATTSQASIWLAGAIGGFATWVVSAPTESVKCRAQVTGSSKGSLEIAREMWRQGGGGLGGIRRLYVGGGITSVRDAVGYGFYFWSYELGKRSWPVNEDETGEQALRVLICGGVAGVITWASIFPLDVIKTRYQVQDLALARPEQRPLLAREVSSSTALRRQSALQVARNAYRQEGVIVFFRGLGVCSARAFIVNAVQWMVYEWVLRTLRTP